MGCPELNYGSFPPLVLRTPPGPMSSGCPMGPWSGGSWSESQSSGADFYRVSLRSGQERVPSPPGTAEGSWECNSVFRVLVFGCDPRLKSCFSPPPLCHTLGPEVICQSQFQRPFLSFWIAQRISPDHHDCYFLRAYYASGHSVLSTFHEWSHLILPLSPKRKSFSFNSPSSLWVNRGWEFAQLRQLVNNWAWYKPSPLLPERARVRICYTFLPFTQLERKIEADSSFANCSLRPAMYQTLS